MYKNYNITIIRFYGRKEMHYVPPNVIFSIAFFWRMYYNVSNSVSLYNYR